MAIDRVALLFGRMAEQLAGYQILGFDSNLAKVDQLLAGQSYIGHLLAAASVYAASTRGDHQPGARLPAIESIHADPRP